MLFAFPEHNHAPRHRLPGHRGGLRFRQRHGGLLRRVGGADVGHPGEYPAVSVGVGEDGGREGDRGGHSMSLVGTEYQRLNFSR